jgi:hypothetical protein
MLTFAHTPTGTTTKIEFDNDEVKSRPVKPAVAPPAIGADVETGKVTS